MPDCKQGNAFMWQSNLYDFLAFFTKESMRAAIGGTHIKPTLTGGHLQSERVGLYIINANHGLELKK
jgi:hypothetical protein